MEFRMRSLKENKQNYNSMAEFPRHFDPLSPNNLDFTQSSRVKQIQAKLNNLMQSQRAESQANNTIFAKLDQRIEHKMLGFDRDDTRTLNKNQPFREVRNSATYKYNTHTQDLAFFKQSMLADLSAQREEIRRQNSKTEQMEMRQLRVEQELRDWVNSHRLEMSKVIQGEQLRGSELGKQKKYQYQYDNLKGIVHSLENKVQLGLDSKGRSFLNLKQDFQHSLQLLKEQMGRQIKNDKDTFTRLVKEIKESFQVLKEALAKDRQQVKQAIFQIQNNQQNSFNKSNRTVQSLASTTSERQQKIQKKMGSMKDDWNSMKLSVNQKLQDFKTLVMNIESTVLQSLQNSKTKGNGDNFEAIKEELAEWKKLSEQKNLNVFREITNAMKILRMEWRKEHDELAKDFQETSKSIKQIRQSVNKRVDKELLSVTQVMGQQFEALTLEIQQINDLVALSKKETEDKITKELAGVKENLSNKSDETVKLVGECQKKMEALEGTWKKQLKELSGSLKDEIVIVQQGAKMQIQSLVSSITEDNEQWEKDLKESMKALKESLTQQIQSNSSSQTKQYSESFKKLEGSIEQLKKRVESGLSSERSETAKQVSKVTEQLTSLIGEWSTKLKKQRETGQTTLKQELSQIKKLSNDSLLQVKQITEELKSKAKQKGAEDQKKISEIKLTLEQSLLKVTKTSDQQSGKIIKKIDALKSEFQGKIKMNYDKLLLEVNTKKQSQQKAKQEQSKAKYAQLDKKIGQANSKMKADVLSELNKSIKSLEEDLGKNSKKVDAFSANMKKDLQTQVQKERKFCIEELGKVKGQIEIKIKARDEKNLSQLNSKKDAEIKQKEEELKAKLTEVEKKTNDTVSKLKADLMAEIGKNKTANNEELTKLKTEVEGKIKAADESKAKKEADSKAKENQIKQKENQLKNRGIQLDKKIQAAKKEIQKSTSDQITKLNGEIDKKIQSYQKQVQSKEKTNFELSVKAKQEQKAKFEELNKKIEQVKEETNKKIAELKGVSLQNMKSQQQQSKRAQQQKLLNIKSELNKAITQSNLALQKDMNQKITKLSQEAFKLQNETSLTFSMNKQALNSLQANFFSERQKNTAVYSKMSSDIMDLADSMMAVIAEIKPAQK